MIQIVDIGESVKAKIVDIISIATNANIALRTDTTSPYTAIKIWFKDLGERKGPIGLISVIGSKIRIKISFGKFSGSIVEEIVKNIDHRLVVARKLINYVECSELRIVRQSLLNWTVLDSSFKIIASYNIDSTSENLESEVLTACEKMVNPLMLAMVELVGYEKISEEREDGDIEGNLTKVVIKRRERSPKNRLLCFAIHGNQCSVCGINPLVRYKVNRNTLEAHHLEPLALITNPKKFDPRKDLVPLCPNCHRAVHTRTPRPYEPSELKKMLSG